MKIFV